MKIRPSSLPVLLLVFGSYLAACGGSSGGDGSGGAGGGGHPGTGTGGQAGKSTGGQAGTASGGQAGTGTGGQAGASAGGQAGTSAGGQAGTSAGGQAGTSVGGHAGTSAGGQAGTSAGGQAGTSAGGHAGTSAGGQAGASAGGQAGTSVGGQAGTSAGGHAGGAAGGAGGGGGAPVACNNLVNGAQVIDKNHHAEAPPVMTGGTIVDGTYFLTAMDKYNGETGTSTHQEVWVYSGNTIQVVQQDGTHFSLSYVVANNTLTYTITCPAAQAGMTGVSAYTATATQIVTVNSDDANELHTFTKQ
jgi:hypothetical protein